MPHQRHNTSSSNFAGSTAHPGSHAPAQDNTPIIEVEGGQDGEAESFAILYARPLSNSTPMPPVTPMNDEKDAGTNDAPSPYLYHVILKVIQLQNWPQTVGSTQYVIGTYTTLGAANLAADNALRRAGYEKDQFVTYVRTEPTEEHQGGLVVFAVTLDGVEFQIQICRTPNAGLQFSAAGSQRVSGDIWHVLQTVMSFHPPTGENRRDFICGTFPSYEAAKSQAYSLLLNCGDPSKSSSSSSSGNQNDGISTFVHYEEVDAAELDGSKGDCILVRAIGKDGTNYMISIAKGYDMEGMGWVEAARRG